MGDTTGNSGLDALADAIAVRVVAKLRAADGPVVLTVQQAAKKLNRHPKSVYAMIASGELPHVLQGGRKMLRWSDIERAIEIATRRG